MSRQIGNAVPVHLAYALGRALGEGLVETEIAGEQEEEEEEEEEEEVNGIDARTDGSEEL